ncbi:MAG: hypothetical protein ACN2B6_06170 [Rickettsiales bacterium]
MADPNRAPEHLAVITREMIAKYIANQLTPRHIHKEPGNDAILVDYFNNAMSEAGLHDAVMGAKTALERAAFPGGKTEVVYRDNTPYIRFEGRETLEMLVQFGVRFDGWEAYKNEHVIDRPLG